MKEKEEQENEEDGNVRIISKQGGAIVQEHDASDITKVYLVLKKWQ